MLTPTVVAVSYELWTGTSVPNAYASVYTLFNSTNCMLNPMLLYTFDVGVRVRVNELVRFMRIRKVNAPEILLVPLQMKKDQSDTMNIEGTLKMQNVNISNTRFSS